MGPPMIVFPLLPTYLVPWKTKQTNVYRKNNNRPLSEKVVPCSCLDWGLTLFVDSYHGVEDGEEKSPDR